MRYRDGGAARTALKIVLSYLIVAGLGLFLLPWFNHNDTSSNMSYFHFLQDTIFLILTGCLLFFLIYTFATKQNSLRETASKNGKRYQSLFDNMCKGGIVFRPADDGMDFSLMDINFIGEQIDGIKRQDYLGQKLSELPVETFDVKLRDGIRRVSETGVPEHFTTTKYRKHHLRQHKDNYLFRLDSGEVVVIYDDITDKILLETELRSSREKLTLQNKIITHFLTINDDDVYQKVLQLITETLKSDFGILGYLNNQKQLIATSVHGSHMKWSQTAIDTIITSSGTSGNLLGRALQEGTHFIQNDQLICPIEHTILENGIAVPVRYQEKTIGVLFLGNSNTPYSTKNAVLLDGICSYIAPILNARLQAQYNAKLHSDENIKRIKSETDLKEAEKLARVGHWEHNLISDTLFWSDEVYRIFGLNPEHFQPSVQKFLQFTLPIDQELVINAYQKSVDERSMYEMTHRIVLDDGSSKFVHERCVTTYGEDDQPTRSLGTIQDITERVEAEEAHKRLATAIDQAVDVIVITDINGTIQYVNPAFEKLTGYSKEDAIGLNPRVLQSGEHPPEFYQELWKTITGGRVWNGRFINKNNDGKLFTEEATITPVKDDSGQIINFVAVKHDISRELELEEQLRQAVKMESIGTLAGGIAHDFNNILGAMLGYTRMAMDDLSKESQPYCDLSLVIQSGDRAADLVKQILLFSRHQEQGFIPIQIQFVIKEVLKMLRTSLPASIILKEHIDQNCPAIMADPTQIHQILINLCTNAKQAMAAQGGDLTITLSQTELKGEALPPDNLKPGKYIQLTIKDSGNGIEEKDLGRIFDPFFTTKGIGEGTGLGLAVVHGIVKSHRGNITVESDAQTGTTFSIILPMAKSDPQTDLAKNEEMIPGGTEHILVVDDEPNILIIRKRMLTGLGYQVSTFASSIKALESFRADPLKYDLLLTDLTMPEMDGKKLASHILKLTPDIPAVLCTGNSGLVTKEQTANHGFCKLLEKPIKPLMLAKTLRELLDDRKKADK